MMTVMELKREDIFRLIELMKKTDEVLYKAHDRWSDCFEMKGFIPVKAAVLIWGRISELLGFSSCSCTSDIPVLKLEDFMGGDVSESIAEYAMSYFDLAVVEDDNLSKAGIEIMYDVLEYDDFINYQELVNTKAMENGEEISMDESFNRTIGYLKEVCCTEVAEEFPDFYRSMVSFVEMNEFYAEVFYIKSRRIGRFVRAYEYLMEKLPRELCEGISSLIERVFIPLYCLFPELTIRGVNNKGEYYTVYAQGAFISSDEEVDDIHKRPYADIAVALLDRLMTEAEALAPELLSDGKHTGGEALAAVKKAAYAA